MVQVRDAFRRPPYNLRKCPILINSRYAPQVTLEPFQLLHEWGYRFYQPTWLADSAAGAYALSSPPAGRQNRLCLVPFPAEQRFLLEEQINVIACHKSQSIALQTIFDQTDIA